VDRSRGSVCRVPASWLAAAANNTAIWQGICDVRVWHTDEMGSPSAMRRNNGNEGSESELREDTATRDYAGWIGLSGAR
jgi:hypothetical protein